MTNMPESGIPKDYIRSSAAIAIFPSTLAGGFVFGGQFGRGVIVSKDEKTGKWSVPAVFTIAGLSWGLQIGGQATDIILLIRNERGVDGLLQSKFKLGGDASIAVGPVGREAEAATDLMLKSGILSYSRSRGAFIGVKLEGAVIAAEDENNAALYGTGVTAKDILKGKQLFPTKSAERLMADLSQYEK
ncbi:MAG: lipid-binding SYLF domain-containing protein [Candidatus Omnitrophica bacterium]|nr:lipid-binding SYLF domain-containing protein [Candidatus Omnitrophota bacterium]